jgi:V8-like Glu-specific endopeptidase
LKNFQQILGTLLLVLICISPIFAATANAKPLTNTEFTKETDDRSGYLPIVPPTPHIYDRPLDPTTIVYDMATGTETEVQYESSTVADELGIQSTEPYAGLLPSDVNPATVFPPDDRTVVPYSTTTTYPWRTVCKIYMKAADGSGWMGSAAMIGAGQDGHGYWILTAAHCAYMHDHGGWVSSIEVIPGYDGAQSQQHQMTPYYHAWVTYMVTYTAWVDSADWNYDIAWCKLDRNLGDYTGWMGRLTADPGWGGYTGIQNTAGYPGDLDGGVRMYFDADYGTYATENKIWFLMDVMGGQSGSPVWHYDGTSRYIIGNVAYHGDLPYGNSGTRINQVTFDWLNYYLALYPAPTDKADLLDDGQTWSGFSPTTVTAGVTSFHVWNDVRNFGTAASGGFYVDYYASVDNVITTSDYLIGWDYITNVNALAYADSDLTKIFPSSIPPGTYYVGWIIDSLGYVSEFDETNNIAYKTTYKLTVVAPKYAITFYSDPTTIGSITFAGTTYTNGQIGQYAAGTYTVTANAPSGWVFSNWVTTGGVSISGSTVTVTGAGTLKAVFKHCFEIWTDKTTYHIGEKMKLYVRVRNPGTSPLPVRALIALKLTDGSYYVLLDMTTTLPAGYDSGNVLYDSFTLPAVPLGNYAWVAALCKPGTYTIISLSQWNWQLLAAATTQTQSFIP